MEDIIAEIVASAAWKHLDQHVRYNEMPQEWFQMIEELIHAQTREDFWVLSGILRQNDNFVKPIKMLVATYKVRTYD